MVEHSPSRYSTSVTEIRLANKSCGEKVCLISSMFDTSSVWQRVESYRIIQWYVSQLNTFIYTADLLQYITICYEILNKLNNRYLFIMGFYTLWLNGRTGCFRCLHVCVCVESGEWSQSCTLIHWLIRFHWQMRSEVSPDRNLSALTWCEMLSNTLK